MAETPHLRLIPEAVHADVMGDEALVLSFETGKYYTIRGSGADIIRALAVGPVHEDAILGALATDFPDVSDTTRVADTEGFVAMLLAERIVERAYSDATTRIAFTGSYGFQPLEIEAGLADILTLDPIHGVSREGWPKKA
jgi:hypothetical protein